MTTKSLNIIDILEPLLDKKEQQFFYLHAKINGVNVMSFLDTEGKISISNDNFYKAVMGAKANF